ncbi:hypothetical protein COEREDRAFT_7305 [Coemansia reversa NRRL 1564]|uniref:Uncharacterized protein n=1 Tax=Coemansia reversa (strain ATCC 12441 / NRRL 1564) TaxID=763665 RepID=A0A2G5BFD2_COERN|nr:hypothetical protein COEREDRAFT_7305 [Coemansia reversa NRRL 1564]|eukprot:PIA17713.1 hypothetical protein COEREDRAFT_7305 [Coemansia reversa NRRL 1564]
MAYSFGTNFIVSAAAVIFSLALSAKATHAPHASHMHQCRGFTGVGAYGGAYPYGNFGYGNGIGFPYASSFTNAFNADNNYANYNDDTLYINDKDATTANSNVNSYNNANVIG